MRELLLILLISSKVFAQSTDAVFLFTVTDSNKLEMADLKASASAITGSEMVTDKMLTVSFNSALAMYVLHVPERLAGNIIMIQLQRQNGNTVETMNIYYKSSKQGDLTSGCHSCVCNDVIFDPGKYVFDMPMQAASWSLIPDAAKQLDGQTLQLKDISLLQNWHEQKMK